MKIIFKQEGNQEEALPEQPAEAVEDIGRGCFGSVIMMALLVGGILFFVLLGLL